KKAGFWIVGMDGYATQTLQDIDKNAKLAVVMGNEGAGMRRLIQEACDMTVRLDMNPKVESLNVSVAAAIMLYELRKL
ncbi:MAG: 23S rRNA (guanosine(2251)-2'-O)-methyltransferase RlmB, partial [Alphaproteobacteria bacterium]|nr:23S rRNA (guanosine(2251)-2'-O)-methyltransferase RlmB [Alphaproteobacteria bacterium]